MVLSVFLGSNSVHLTQFEPIAAVNNLTKLHLRCQKASQARELFISCVSRLYDELRSQLFEEM
jgi:hypothetical protein